MTFAAAEIPARTQMGSSLGFHIIFACFGIAYPALILIVNGIGIRRNDPVALLLARRWAKVGAVIFAVGAVSGTVLSYELGLLWPTLMGRYGAAYGIPFAIEGIWFFIEAISMAVYIYGWDRLSPKVHWWTGVPMLVSGLLSAAAVVSANAWMNQPSGFAMKDGKITHVDAWAVIFNRAMPYEVPHMILAAFMVVGFTVAGVYAVGMLRGRRDRYHQLGFRVSFFLAAAVAPVQVVLGDFVARAVEKQQPQKFAAMELVDHTGRGITEWLGGILPQRQGVLRNRPAEDGFHLCGLFPEHEDHRMGRRADRGSGAAAESHSSVVRPDGRHRGRAAPARRLAAVVVALSPPPARHPAGF